ncbi:MAG TPA: DoxX family protein [Candidatus Cybelea sp.]|nr:DoxX family protein [Candidatus Cybelea sp.]
MAQQQASPKLFIPGLGGLYESSAPYIYPALRVIVGAILVAHGYPKVFYLGISGVTAYLHNGHVEPALLVAYLITAVEFFGGICIAIGLFTRFWAAGAAIEFAYIVFVFKWAKGYYGYAGGFELELLMGLLTFAISLRGSGRLSVDRAIGHEL